MLTVRLTPRAAQYRDDSSPIPVSEDRFPPDIISHAVWLYHRYCLSFRDVEDLLAERESSCRMKLFGSGAESLVPITPGG